MTRTETAVTLTEPREATVLVIMSACTVLVVGFVASINLAVPLLAASSLRPSASQLLWIVDAYVMVFACLVIPAGAAGDRCGRKGVLLVGLVTFAAGAALSAAAPGVSVLIAGRVLTGIGAAGVLPNSLALLVHATAPARRSRAIAVWAAMSGIGGVIGNIGGGFVLTAGSWRWLFVAVVPIAVLCAAVVGWNTPRTDRHRRPLRIGAVIVLTLATLTLLTAIIQGPEQGWASVVVLSSFGLSVGLFILWAAMESRADQPLLDPGVFKVAAVRAACLGMLAMFFGSYGLFFLNASVLQYGYGYTALEAGLAIMPLTLPLLVGGRWVPLLVQRFGITATVTAAFVIAGVSLIGLGTSIGGPYWTYGAWLLAFGIGFALAVPSLTAEITTALPREQAGVGAGLQSTTRELGSALGVAVVGTLLSSQFTARLRALGGFDGATVHTVPGALATFRAQHDAVIAAYLRSASAAIQGAGLALLVIGALITSQSLAGTRRQTAPRRKSL